MKYILIDNAIKVKSEVYTEVLKDKSRKEAIERAKFEWGRLTPKEQNHRDDFYLLEMTNKDYEEADGEYFGKGKMVWSAK